MRVWMIWLQEADEATWLQAAWDDNSTADDNDGWQEVVDRARKLATDNGYEMRIQQIEVPGVYDLFEPPTVIATPIDDPAGD